MKRAQGDSSHPRNRECKVLLPQDTCGLRERGTLSRARQGDMATSEPRGPWELCPGTSRMAIWDTLEVPKGGRQARQAGPRPISHVNPRALLSDLNIDSTAKRVPLPNTAAECCSTPLIPHTQPSQAKGLSNSLSSSRIHPTSINQASDRDCSVAAAKAPECESLASGLKVSVWHSRVGHDPNCVSLTNV